ncbi:MAG TPA: hypothetical protein VNQ34_07195 [Xanthobacteraceae bacterium]|nr:hypothetical protein [Xanthobacteraceae bacterium]
MEKAIIGLVGVIIGAFISAFVVRRSSYISSVTTERTKWIDKLRTNIADLVGTLATISLKSSSDTYRKSAEYDADKRKAETLVATVILQLNPDGSIDKNIIKLLHRLPFLAERSDKYRDAENALILHSQFLLKEEWEKVKYETQSAIARWWKTDCNSEREEKYRNFCESKESFLSEIK